MEITKHVREINNDQEREINNDQNRVGDRERKRDRQREIKFRSTTLRKLYINTRITNKAY